MADFEFDVVQRRTKPVTFSLGLEPDQDEGDTPHSYTFIPPKAAMMLMPVLAPEVDQNEGIALTKATFDWLGAGMSKEDNLRIQARLQDPKDDLDIDTLSDVIQKLSENSSGRPTS